MKKVILMIILMVSLGGSTYAIPYWMGGCRWTGWAPTVHLVSSADGFCTWEREMVGHSWLIGDCSAFYTYSIPCSADPLHYPLPGENEADGCFFTNLASSMAALETDGFTIDSTWKDVTILESNPNVVKDAVTFRLTLAGYNVDPSWFAMSEAPCPFPQPSLHVFKAPITPFINIECHDEVLVYPNPNSGHFTLQANYFESITNIEVVRNSDLVVVYAKNTPLINIEAINIVTPTSGAHTLRLTTPVGVYTRQILILPPPTED